MMEKSLLNRVLSLMLAAAILCGFVIPVHAAEESVSVCFQQVDNSAVSAVLPGYEPIAPQQEESYAPTDEVRVSIVLEKESTVAAGFEMKNVARNPLAMAYRQKLQTQQAQVTASIEKRLEQKLDVAWNLTLAANLISANVEYGQIEAIEKVPGVEKVLIETRYDPAVVSREETNNPNMATSPKQIGSTIAWDAGYTGAGARIAVIDTGIDTEHQSFNEEGYKHSLSCLAEKKGIALEEYKKQLNLLDAQEVNGVLDQLHVKVDPAQAFVSEKIPFAYNYVDRSYYVTHAEDTQSEHGSHVCGIAAANAYIPKQDGTFSKALDSVKVQGVAPDAQLIVMKVFGKRGGAYDSDYMVAIEDAIILGCDTVNLSLGAANPGNSRHANKEYQTIMDNLTKAGIVVCISAGNSGSWVQNAANGGRLYADDVSMQTNGNPGTYTNSLGVASVNNDGTTGLFIQVKDALAVYNESPDKHKSLATLAGEQEYIFIDGSGTPEEWAAIGEVLKGKIALCSRGEIAFFEKGNNAVNAGAIATVIYNNQPGSINMDLKDYTKSAPCVSISQEAGMQIRENSEAVKDEAGKILYYTGKMTVSDHVGTSQFNSEFYNMSAFSSWGIPGSLEMKPEITAPGGGIYSVFGKTPSGGGHDMYENMSGTSMASPQVAGMAALVAQHIRANHLTEKTGMTPRQLIQSLLMSTAEPLVSGESHCYFPVLQQGAGLANVGRAVSADSYITMGENATNSFADGKVKVELGDDPQRTGVYRFSFTIHNLQATDKAFDLSADFFTQKMFEDYANSKKDDHQKAFYMDTETTALPVNVTWEADGRRLTPSALPEGLDFNGDGSVNAADGQVLLDYVVDNSTAIRNLDKADMDNDGDVDTYDAYLFFKGLGSGSLLVPADGSVQVDVTVELTDAWRDCLEHATNGMYVQGYVFARSAASQEGVKGTTHSIPVLGFFGNWTDPSMYDAGTLAGYRTGEDFRTPYLGEITANTYLVTYANDPKNEYALGGNPLIPDAKYMPERNAINSVNGDAVSKVQFSAIRNAAAVRFTAENVTKGKTLQDAVSGGVDAAFYFSMTGKWQKTGYTIRTNLVPKGAEEGDQLRLNLALAPEYYMDAEGNTDWKAMGKGANFSLPLVVDNTAPVVEEISHNVIGNTLVVTASDNQYIAAVALYNKQGSKLYASSGAMQDVKAGASAQFTLDLTDVNGDRFALQVMDYAKNTTTYLLEMEIGEQQPLPEMMAFSLDQKGEYWFAFNKDTKYDPKAPHGLEPYCQTNQVFTAATIADHVVIAATKDGKLFAMPENDLSEENLIAETGMLFTDMAYNKSDGRVYGVCENKLYTIDKLTGETAELGTIGIATNTLACDANGTFYCNELGTDKIYKFTATAMEKPELLGSVGKWARIESQFIQSMEINPNTGRLCWNSYYVKVYFHGYEVGRSYYVEMDPKTGKSEVYNDLQDEISCLIIPERTSGGSWTEPTDKISKVTVSSDSINMLKGTTRKLSALVQPWTAKDRGVTWSAQDETVAKVDEFGTVTAVGVGTTTVTAASVLDPNVTATCSVTVEALNITLKGVLQSKEGTAEFFSWDMAKQSSWEPGAEIDTKMISAAYDSKNKFYYVQEDTTGLLMHRIGENGVTAQVSETNGAMNPLWAMAYSTYFSTEEMPLVSSVYGYYFLPPKDPMHLDISAFELSGVTGYLTAVASLGYEKYQDRDTGKELDTEHIVLLDNAGTVSHFWTYRDGESFKARIAQFPSDLDLGFEGYDNLRKMYCSMVTDNNGDLYLSYFNGAENELYRLVLDKDKGAYHAERFGTFGENVWPAILTEAVNHTDNPSPNYDLAAAATQEMEAVTVTAQKMQAAVNQLQNDTSHRIFRMTDEARRFWAEMQSDSKVEEGEKTVTVTVTAKDAAGADIASNNALMGVSYDTSKLELTDATIHGAYTSKVQAEGKVTFGYVSLDEIPAGSAVATLKFKVLTAEESAISVETIQINNEKGGTEELLIEFAHENTEVRDAVEATCTEPGYTGDTYCLDCGQLVAKGEVIPAKGHTTELRNAKEATCTEPGYTGDRVCTVCGEIVEKGREITALGHATELQNAKKPTCTEPGYTGDHVCANCGEIVEKGKEIPAAGHTCSQWKVTREATCFADGEKTGTCTVCGETITEVIPANTDHCPCKEFEDLDCTKWYHEGVDFVLENGIMEGVGDHLFNPNGKITRGQMVTMLYRMAGNPEVTGENPFTDVQKDKWYTDAVLWAAESGITEGITETTFAPNRFVTREQMVTFLYRYAKLTGKDVNAAGDLSKFDDAQNVHDFAKIPMAWAVGEGMIEGMDNRLYPTNTTTRAQGAAVLMRYSK